MPWYKRNLILWLIFFEEQILAKFSVKKKTFYSLEGDFRCIPNKISNIYALFVLRNA
jgi:hypothetical protein